MNWKEYQNQVASIFNSIGASTTIEKKVEGVRGIHEVDVFVELEKFGIKMIWICECKYWNSAVPKEKVLALYEISKDVGADKAFLFSESGFQSGAVRAVNNTNIVLASTDEINEIIKNNLFEHQLLFYLKDFERIKSIIKTSWIDDNFNFNPLSNLDFDKSVLIDGNLMYLTLDIQKVLNGQLPIILRGVNSESKKCDTMHEVISTLSDFHSEAKIVVQELLVSIEKEKENIKKLRNNFCENSHSLIGSVERQILDNIDNFDTQVWETLKYLKLVGSNADNLNQISRGTLKIQFRKTMQSLIDNVYPYLTENKVCQKEWELKKDLVKKEIKDLENIGEY
ncbi:restriction endonuclease [Echinicola marina]|uniref:restriction endonuclease n=1 Tax=Echinicola marina TaxID=2859768 RepID=UPI001CF60DA0|nr:restriction endonuclease [Echinicola marina]UCS93953.1 restriction endonuclease [Echinicola marina]